MLLKNLKYNVILTFGSIFLVIAISITYNQYNEIPLKIEFAKACNKEGKNCLKDDVILLHGRITSLSSTYFKEFLSLHNRKITNLKIKYVCFNSIGGRNKEAIKIGEKIAKEGLQTCLAEKYILSNDIIPQDSTECSSSCPYILLAGSTRNLIGKSACIGVHASGQKIAGTNFDMPNYTPEDDKNEYISALKNYSQLNTYRDEEDIHIELVNYSFRVKNEHGKYLTTKQIKDFKVFTSDVTNFENIIPCKKQNY